MHDGLTKPKIYVLLSNSRKSNNFGPLIRCCVAHDVQQLVFIGYPQCSIHGSHGSHKHIDITSYPTFDKGLQYLRTECGVSKLVGILDGIGCEDEEAYNQLTVHRHERTQTVTLLRSMNQSSLNQPPTFTLDHEAGSRLGISFPVHNFNIDLDDKCSSKNVNNTGAASKHKPDNNNNICFLVSAETTQLSQMPIHQAMFCDTFVHVPISVPIMPFSALDAASIDKNGNSTQHLNYLPKFLDTQTCLSIVLHRFATQFLYMSSDYTGYKFDVAKVTKGQTKEQQVMTSETNHIVKKQYHDDGQSHQNIVIDKILSNERETMKLKISKETESSLGGLSFFCEDNFEHDATGDY
mmetsp:Transcript_33670/g.38992  ORF Transcript_33670/g.38992 Transcript_33670/m.38992 type:complete len:351 (-) Transcript_33670:202-1254(-)